MSAFGRKPTLKPLNFPCHPYQLEAMINVLERKGLLTSMEVRDELEVIVATKGKKGVSYPPHPPSGAFVPLGEW